MKNLLTTLTIAATMAATANASDPEVFLPDPDAPPVQTETPADGWDAIELLSPGGDVTPDRHFSRLSEEDFREVAEQLGVETAAIKAVVDIEAGKAHEGFFQPGKPIINFDLSMYRKFAPRHGVSLSKAKKKAPVIFASPNRAKYGSYQAAQYARLDAAREIDDASALESAFWGMFQIGGFNWKLCGCSSVEEFVEKMSRSERDQLDLFASLITNCGMLQPLQKKQWLPFALKYNGPRAKSRGYHKRMASAYSRHKAAEAKAAKEAKEKEKEAREASETQAPSTDSGKTSDGISNETGGTPAPRAASSSENTTN